MGENSFPTAWDRRRSNILSKIPSTWDCWGRLLTLAPQEHATQGALPALRPSSPPTPRSPPVKAGGSSPP